MNLQQLIAISANSVRAMAIFQMVQRLNDENDLSFNSAELKCSQEFGILDLGEDEYAAAIAALSPPDDEPATVEVETALAPEPTAPAEPAPKMTRAEAMAELHTRQEAIVIAKKRLAMAQARQNRARAAVANAVMEWQGEAPTAQEIKRCELDAINATRRLEAEGGNHASMDPKYWDRFAKATGTRGSANDFARSFPAGLHGDGRGVKGNRRGSYPASAFGRRIKPPSEL